MRPLTILSRLTAALCVGLSLAPAAAQELKVAVAADATSIDPHFFNLFPNNNIAEPSTRWLFSSGRSDDS
jgi:peptide/nickel transport system substrate-binding protein